MRLTSLQKNQKAKVYMIHTNKETLRRLKVLGITSETILVLKHKLKKGPCMIDTGSRFYMLSYALSKCIQVEVVT